MNCYDCGKEMIPAIYPLSKAGPDLQDIPAGVPNDQGELWFQCPDWHRGQWIPTDRV